MKPKTAIQKGKVLENHIAGQIKLKKLDKNAQRSAGSGSGTREKRDLVTNIQVVGREIGIEAKNQKVAKMKDWWKQTQDLEKLGYEPVLVYKLKGEGLNDSKAVIYLDFLLDLIKKAQEPKINNPDRELEYALKNLLASLKKVIKLLVK